MLYDPFSADTVEKMISEEVVYDEDLKSFDLDLAHPNHSLKMQMKGKYKLVTKGEDDNQIFGVDVLRGNVYLSSEGADGLKGLPLQANGKFTMSLEDLKNPDGIGTYFINEKEEKMTHRVALEKFRSIAKERFSLPDDFVANMLDYSANIDEICEHVLLPPTKTMHVLSKELVKVDEYLKSKIYEIGKSFHQYLGLNDTLREELLNEKVCYIRDSAILFRKAVKDNNVELAKLEFTNFEEDIKSYENYALGLFACDKAELGVWMVNKVQANLN